MQSQGEFPAFAYRVQGNSILRVLIKAHTYKFPFAKLALEGVEIRNPNIELLGRRTFLDDQDSMILGMNVLTKLHIYISSRENALYVTSADAH